MNAPLERPSTTHLAAEVADLSVSVRLWWTIGLAVFGGFNSLLLLFTVPKFEKIFDDMIPGGSTKLPVLTRMVVNWAQTTPVCELVVLGLVASGLVPLWQMRSIRSGTISAALIVALLAAQFIVTLLAMYLPLISVIQSMSRD